jgi:REP element-mobilizing transposase RayT
MRTNYPHHLPAFDYIGGHRYFLTFCTHNRFRLFTDKSAVELVVTQFLRGASEESFAISAYCFMPDHVHMVVEGLTENADLKRFTSRAKQLSGSGRSHRIHVPNVWRSLDAERPALVRLKPDTTKSAIAAFL